MSTLFIIVVYLKTTTMYTIIFANLNLNNRQKLEIYYCPHNITV